MAHQNSTNLQTRSIQSIIYLNIIQLSVYDTAGVWFQLTYWGIDGLLKTKGKNSYGALIEIITNESQPAEIRAKAVKSIAEYSKQPFDRNLTGDPGHWKVEELRVSEIKAWQQNGYSDGKGYAVPITHNALKKPSSAFEKIVSKLDKKLKRSREEDQDLANPSNWLVIASDKDIEEIQMRWKLPEKYRLFLQNFSPLNVSIVWGKQLNRKSKRILV